METRSNHILVGGIVLALVVALLGFIIWLSQASGDSKKEYDIFFKQAVDGLAKGSAVTFNGVPVGQVESINLEPKTPEFVRVRISVQGDAPVQQGVTATINGVGFTGVSQIQIDPSAQRDAPALACPDQNTQNYCPYGVPVIPTRPGGFAAILNSAPELLQRVQTLTERLTELLSDRNQNSIADILDNVERMSDTLADRAPEVSAALADARIAIRQAGNAAEEFGKLANSSDVLIRQEAQPLVADLRKTIQKAEGSMSALEAAVNDARPGIQAFSKQTLPEVGQLVRDLRATSQSLRDVTEKVQTNGAGALLGGNKLPDYEGPK